MSKLIDKAPTDEQLAGNACIVEDGRSYIASWYPQLGGYSAKAWVEFDLGPDNSCFDVHIFHDGDFPRNDEPPSLSFHHCSADQFIRFGALVNKMQESK